VRDGRDVFNHRDAETCTSQRTKRRLTTGPWTVHKDTDLLHAMIHGLFSGVSGHKLGCEGSRLTRALKSFHAARRPRDDSTGGIRDGHNGVVEGSANVSDTAWNILFDTLASF
jgi:hypothetical protein